MSFDAELIAEPRPRNRKNSKSSRRPGTRSLVSQTWWLDGQPFWHEGRVAWHLDDRHKIPTHADITNAHHSLTRLQKLVGSNSHLDPETVALTQRRAKRLEMVKQLRELEAPDYPRLASVSRSRNPAATERLITLLTAEALCLNPLPGPDGLQPSQTLLRNSELTRRPILDYLKQPDIPLAGRMLAALLLGALETRNNRFAPNTFEELDCTELRRAYAFGGQYGLTNAPALTGALLLGKGGVTLAYRCAQALQKNADGILDTQLLRQRLALDLEPEHLVALAEATVQLDEHFKRWRQFTPQSAPNNQGFTKKSIQRLREKRESYLSRLRTRLSEMVQQKVEAESLILVVRLVDSIYEKQVQCIPGSRLPASSINHDYILNTAFHFSLEILETLTGSHGSKVVRNLTFLIEQANAIWPLGSLKRTKDSNAFVKHLHDAVDNDWTNRAKPALRILKHCDSPEICLQCLHRKYHRILARLFWQNPEQYQLFFSLLDRLGAPPHRTNNLWAEELAEAIDSAPSVNSARHILGNLIDALQDCPPEFKHDLLYEILSESLYPRTESAQRLALLLPIVDKLIKFRGAVSDSFLCGYIISALLRANVEMPRTAGDEEESDASRANRTSIQKWIIDELLSHIHRTNIGLDYSLLPDMVSLLLSLAQGDIAHFRDSFSVALRLRFRDTNSNLREGINRLKVYPGLRPSLAANFVRQPMRCLNVIMRLGQLQTLPAPVMAPLACFKASGEPTEPGDDWPGIDWIEIKALERNRESKVLQSLALRLLRAQAWLAEPHTLPSGIKRALTLPHKMRRELEHLEQRVEHQSDKAALQSRIDSLRAQLADDSYLQKRVTDEVHDALFNVTIETELRAVEGRLIDCIRTRLEEVVGPVSRDKTLDDDLINAVLLTTDVESNRKLLRQLLRRHLEGDRLWHYRHPGNRLFLQVMGTRNLDVERWLAAHKKRYRCQGAEGGVVHLRLERHPLQILQMGNYFNTCLSVGGCNSFSTVANACELNKRVVFATDGGGQVVGRQLIGINEKGRLVGFRVYNSLAGIEASTRLNQIFFHYVQTFAFDCGVELDNEGNVPILFAQDWYDDGVVSWEAIVKSQSCLQPALAKPP